MDISLQLLLSVFCTTIVKGSYLYSLLRKHKHRTMYDLLKVTRLVNGRAGAKCRFSSRGETRVMVQYVC